MLEKIFCFLGDSTLAKEIRARLSDPIWMHFKLKIGIMEGRAVAVTGFVLETTRDRNREPTVFKACAPFCRHRGRVK